MKPDENQVLYQKKGMIISKLALYLLSKDVGDRIAPITYYQEEFKVSRGTVQNALNYLKENGAIQIVSHGHQGTFIEKIDYRKLQDSCLIHELLGIMPLPYSLTYEGFATAIYSELDELNFNMAYARGAVGRIELVESGTYQFAVCSRYAAEQTINNGKEIEIAIDFGPGSFLSKHVLLLADDSKDGICDGMKVAYDSNSLDQSRITDHIVRGKRITLVPIRTQQTIGALMDGAIDAGIWNYDDVLEHHRSRFKVVCLAESDYNDTFSTAVLVIKAGDEALKALLKKYISIERVLKILSEVKEKRREPFY